MRNRMLISKNRMLTFQVLHSRCSILMENRMSNFYNPENNMLISQREIGNLPPHVNCAKP